MSVIRHSNIDINKITIGPLKKTPNGRKMINILHDDKPLVFQTPKMVAPYGLTEYRDEATGKINSFVLDGSFGTDNEELDQFLTTMEQIEQKVLEVAAERSMEWFDSDEPFTVSEIKKAKMFKSQVKRHSENKYPPTLKMKFMYYDNRCHTRVFDTKKVERDPNFIQKGSKVVSILELRSVWLINNSFGVTFKVIQTKAENKEQIQDYAFIDDEDQAVEDTEYDDY